MSLSRWVSASCCLLLLSLAACFPTSQHPIHGAEDTSVPALFAGTWVGKIGDVSVTLTFLTQEADLIGQARVKGSLVRHTGSGPTINDGWLEFEADVTELRGELFASLRALQVNGVEASSPKRGYFLLRIVPEGSSFRAVGMNSLVLQELLNRGDLDGEIEASQAEPQLHLTSSARSLRAFLVVADLDELFADTLGVFQQRTQ